MAKKKKSTPPKELSKKELQAMLAEAEALQEQVTQNLASTEKAYSEITATNTTDSYYVRDPKTGLSPAQVEARGLVAEAAKTAAAAGIEGKVVTPTGSAGKFIPKPTDAPPADENYKYSYQWVGASTGPVDKLGEYVLIKSPNASGVPDWYTDSNGMLFYKGKPYTGTYQGVTYKDGKGPGYKEPSGANPVPTGLDPATKALIEGLQAQIAALTTSTNKQAAAEAQAKLDAAAAAEAAKQVKAQNAITVLTDRFAKYGLASLVPKIRELALTGASEDTIALQLQETPEYKQRFIGNEERIKKGLSVLDPGTYLGLEDRYRQIIRAYGLKQFDNDAYVTQFIANDISPEEVSSRVVNAVQRVQNADPAVSAMLRQYYNIGVTDMVAYVLDPANQLPKIERQIGAAEIGVAAGRQGLTAGVNVAEQLAAQGVTQAEAQRGYATIADILPQAGKLSEIYTGVLDQYNQAEAEQEVFNSLASAQRKRRALTEREIASFGGASGLGRGSLGTNIGGQI